MVDVPTICSLAGLSCALSHGFPPGREADESQRCLEVISKEHRTAQAHFSTTNSINDKNFFHLTRKLSPTLATSQMGLTDPPFAQKPKGGPSWTRHPLSIALSVVSLNGAFAGPELWALAYWGRGSLDALKQEFRVPHVAALLHVGQRRSKRCWSFRTRLLH